MQSENDQIASSQSIPTSSQPSAGWKCLRIENIGDGNKLFPLTKFTEWFYNVFQSFGRISDFHVVRNYTGPIPVGDVFIVFEDPKSAWKAFSVYEKQIVCDDMSYPEGKLSDEYLEMLPKRCERGSENGEKLISQIRGFVQIPEEKSDSEMSKPNGNETRLLSEKVGDNSSSLELQSIQKLANDDIHNILNRLDLKDLTRCQLVCTRWNMIAQDTLHSKWKLRLDFHIRQPSLDEDISTILKKCPNLKELGIGYKFTVNESTIKIIGESCPLLGKLVATNLSNIPTICLTEYCPGLKVFDFNHRETLSEKNLGELLRAFNDLECLILHNQAEITGESFQYLSKLRVLDLRGCEKITSESFVRLAIWCHSSLEELKIGPISMSSFSIICQSFQKLHTLELKNLNEDVTVEALNLLTRIERLENLRISMNNARDEEFINLIKCCRRLKVLRLPYTFNLTTKAISQLPIFCHDLQHLDFSNSEMSKQSFHFISRLNSLTYLSLEGTSVDDDEIEKVLLGCPKLSFLDVDECELVTPQTIYTVFVLKCKKLLNPRLVIKFCGRSVEINTLRGLQDLHDFEGYYARRYDNNSSLDSHYYDLRFLFDSI